jgi:ribonuclease D
MDLINSTSALEAACKRLAESRYITVDTEFMRDTTFWPKLCLIQMAGPEGDAVVVDTMAKALDLDPFFRLMGDDSVVKVFHAARQDIEIIYYLGDLIPYPLFDTQIAAAVCGYGESVGYEALAKKLANVQIDKTHRFTDWARRPLSKAQLAYAADDVIHLRPIYERLAAEVERMGRSEWIREEMDILTSPETYATAPENAWKRLKPRARKPLELALLKELAAWREREAQTRDVPRSRVLKDDGLYEIALHAPRDEAALAQLRAVPNGFERSARGREVLGIISSVRSLPAGDLPPLPRQDGPQRASGPVADLLKVLLKHVADRNRVAARMIATTEDIETLAAADDASIPALHGWRREIFGDTALALKQGRIALAVADDRVIVEQREPSAPSDKPKSRRRRRRPPLASD